MVICPIIGRLDSLDVPNCFNINMLEIIWNSSPSEKYDYNHIQNLTTPFYPFPLPNLMPY